MIIAIDGPAASGKGTLARGLSERLGFAYLDTGLLYRATGLIAQQRDIPPLQAAQELKASDLENPLLKLDKAAALASKVAILPAVRDALLAFQRDFAKRHNQPDGVVLDGRDIGTVVCPNADWKFFITASLEKRVERRLNELILAGMPAIEEQVRDDMRVRDERDRNRSVAPLVKADDAIELDTTSLSTQAALDQVLAIMRNIKVARG